MRRGAHLIRLYSDARPNSSTLARRIAKRLLKPAEGAPKISAWKLWSSHLRNNSFEDLKRLQDDIMEKVVVAGTKTNSMLMGEINQWQFTNGSADIKTPTLLLHGYAATSMAFHRNFEGLSDYFQNLFAIDLPANGLSKCEPLELPYTAPLPLKLQIKDRTFKLDYTLDYMHHKSVIQRFEDYYLDAIEQWRLDNRLGPINLIAHSFGGYISFKYAVKYPNSVNKLCLVSPLGVERSIYSVNNHFRKNTPYDLEFENPASKFYVGTKWEIPKILFERQTALLRDLGPLGAKLCWNYIMAAYFRVPDVDFKKYVFELFYGKGAQNQIAKDIFIGLFSRRLFARDPLLDGLQYLSVNKLLLLYGEHDWMNRYAGMKMTKMALNQGLEAEYSEVTSAGHNLFLDNPVEFNDKIIEFFS
ncbi:LAMI_0H16050g1_1 [Lachancea mirantina]|uniref:LAMI_0H16050g1_1 n=1 Tax=Lachancea mirantina TaxID=1230905 RepID=A0A1G4KIW7_9SACH|nr:LAMI_0H16050g1_1 [Lachancea mirantina]